MAGRQRRLLDLFAAARGSTGSNPRDINLGNFLGLKEAARGGGDRRRRARSRGFKSFTPDTLQLRGLFGSGQFTKGEINRGYRKLGTPNVRKGQKKVAFPGVPTKEK